jgi:hypothetical protein
MDKKATAICSLSDGSSKSKCDQGIMQVRFVARFARRDVFWFIVWIRLQIDKVSGNKPSNQFVGLTLTGQNGAHFPMKNCARVGCPACKGVFCDNHLNIYHGAYRITIRQSPAKPGRACATGGRSDISRHGQKCLVPRLV